MSDEYQKLKYECEKALTYNVKAYTREEFETLLNYIRRGLGLPVMWSAAPVEYTRVDLAAGILTFQNLVDECLNEVTKAFALPNKKIPRRCDEECCDTSLPVNKLMPQEQSSEPVKSDEKCDRCGKYFAAYESKCPYCKARPNRVSKVEPLHKGTCHFCDTSLPANMLHASPILPDRLACIDEEACKKHRQDTHCSHRGERCIDPKCRNQYDHQAHRPLPPDKS